MLKAQIRLLIYIVAGILAMLTVFSMGTWAGG